MNNERLIKSYVWYKDKCFFISTIDRDSSTPYGGHYAETLVWEYDWDTAERGKMVGQDEAGQGNIKAHLSMCERIFYHGLCEASAE